MQDFSEIIRYARPLLIILSSILIGILIERLAVRPLKGLANKKNWRVFEIVTTAFSGLVVWVFLFVGTYAALLNYSEIYHRYHVIIEKAHLVIIIFLASVFVSRILAGLVTIHTKAVEGVLPSPSIFVNLGKIAIYIIGFLIVLQTLKISITPILTALGVGGLAVALALQDTLSNFFAGLQIIASKQVRTGDYVKLTDTNQEGYVSDITWRNTTIRSFKNNMTIVPNAKLASAIVTNYYQPRRQMMLMIPVGIDYSSDLEKVEKVTIETAREILKETPGAVPNFEPYIRYHTFADFSINFNVMMSVREYMDQHIVKHEFVKRLHKRYLKEGINIPFPIRTVKMEGKGKVEK